MHNKDLYEKYDFTKGGEPLKSRNFIFKDNINYNNFLNTLIKTKEIFLFEENFLCQGYFLVIYEDFYFFIKPNKAIEKPLDFVKTEHIFTYKKK